MYDFMSALDPSGLHQGQDLFEFGTTDGQDLMKALQAGTATDVATYTGGQALQMQSLEGQLASITIREELIRFYKRVPKTKAFSTVEEASILQDIGTEGGWVGQLENPPQGDPELARQVAIVKFLRTHCRVGDVLEITKKLIPAVNVSTATGILRLLRALEQSCFFADDTIIPQQIQGIYQQVNASASGNIIDVRNRDLTGADYKLAAQIIADNYGRANVAFQSNGVQSRIDTLVEAQSASVPGAVRIMYPEAGKGAAGDFNLGYSIKGAKTSFGDIEFEPDVFLNIETQGVPTIWSGGTRIEGATSSQAPATPSIALVAKTSQPNSQWTSSDAGAYKYRVAAINQYGKSAAVAQSTATVAAAGGIEITITPGSGSFTTLGYEIYRETAVGSGKIYFMKRIVATSPTGNTVYLDLNADIAGTSQVFILDMNTLGPGELRTMFLKQLAPLHKTPLAKIGPFIQWLQNLYCTFFIYAPQKQVIYKNVKAS